VEELSEAPAISDSVFLALFFGSAIHVSTRPMDRATDAAVKDAGTKRDDDKKEEMDNTHRQRERERERERERG
jgi:hypothetical protein